MVDVVVVGGGVIGLAAALELARRGARVQVLDRAKPGGACSRGNAGWVCPSLSGPVPGPGVVWASLRWMLKADSPLHIRPAHAPRMAAWLARFWRHCNAAAYRRGLEAVAHLNSRTMELFDRLAADGVDFEMHRAGLLFVCAREVDAEHALQDLEVLRRYGYREPRMLRGADLRAFEPALRETARVGVFVAEERHVRPESLVAGLVRRLQERGADLLPGTEVRGFELRGRRVVAVRTAPGEVRAGAVVLAAGAWTGRLAAGLGARLPIEAGKGYSITFEAPVQPLRHPLYLVDRKVVCTPFHGAVRVAGTMEFAGLDGGVDPRRVAAILRAARHYLALDLPSGPALQPWAGLRPMTPDGLPVIGRLPGLDNVVVATGHGMLGVTLAPATAVAVAELVESGRCESFDLAPFAPGRFG